MGGIERYLRPEPTPPGPPSPLGRFVDALPGWLMLAGGLALVAMATLTPAWLELDRLDQQRAVMQQHAEAMTEQTRRYDAFLQAVLADDPVLIERLAYTQLRLEPVGRFSVATSRGQASSWVDLPPGDVDRWLRVEPVSGEAASPTPPVSSRLTRLAGGVARFGLLVAGVICIVGGLWWGPTPADPR